MKCLLTDEQIKSFNEDGYLIVRNCLSIEPIDNMMKFIAHVIKLESLEGESQDLKDKYVLNEMLINLKRGNPSSSSWIYQTLQSSYQLKDLFIKLDLAPTVMQLLHMKDINNLGTVSPAVRFDIPGDTNNIREWHQDGNYFLENQDGNKALVTWIPLNKATKDNGSVIIAKGSHKQRKQKSVYSVPETYKSEQFVTSEELYNDYEKIYIDADRGDIAFIHMDLIHSSGTNITSNEVRYTAQIRFNTINDSNYRPVFIKAEYPEYKRNYRKFK